MGQKRTFKLRQCALDYVLEMFYTPAHDPHRVTRASRAGALPAAL
jgi:hypothetical protein